MIRVVEASAVVPLGQEETWELFEGESPRTPSSVCLCR